MKKTVAALVLLALCCCPALAQDSINWSEKMSVPSLYEQQTYRTNDTAPYIACWPDFGGAEQFIEYAVDFRAEHLPRGTYLSVGCWGMGSHQLSRLYDTAQSDYGAGGYCGFQVWEDGTHAAILTIWDQFCTDRSGKTTVIKARQIYPENEKGAERFEDSLEGSFLHCLVPFDWKEDRSYRALIQIANPYDGTGAHLLFYVCDLETGIWTRLMEFELGYDEAYMFGVAAFLENYLPQFAGEMRSMILRNFRAHPYSENRWIAAKSACFLQNYDHAGSYNYGAANDAFWAVSTGIPGRGANPDAAWYSVTRAESGCPY